MLALETSTSSSVSVALTFRLDLNPNLSLRQLRTLNDFSNFQFLVTLEIAAHLLPSTDTLLDCGDCGLHHAPMFSVTHVVYVIGSIRTMSRLPYLLEGLAFQARISGLACVSQSGFSVRYLIGLPVIRLFRHWPPAADAQVTGCSELIARYSSVYATL